MTNLTIDILSWEVKKHDMSLTNLTMFVGKSIGFGTCTSRNIVVIGFYIYLDLDEFEFG